MTSFLKLYSDASHFDFGTIFLQAFASDTVLIVF